MDSIEKSMPNRLGKLAKDTDGNLVLINENGKAYAVDNDLSTVWMMLDGHKNYPQLLEALTEDASCSPQEIDGLVRSALEKLSAAELVSWESN